MVGKRWGGITSRPDNKHTGQLQVHGYPTGQWEQQLGCWEISPNQIPPEGKNTSGRWPPWDELIRECLRLQKTEDDEEDAKILWKTKSLQGMYH